MSEHAAGAVPPTEDVIQPFILEVPALRGRLVRLGSMVEGILSRHDYPTPVAVLLGEMLALAGLLSSLLKFDGIFTLQTKGDGPVRMMVADMTSEGELRGYAEFEAEDLEALSASQGPEGIGSDRLLGAGYLAYTVDRGSDTERYQGIVELTGSSLADCVHHYFRQSEQLKTAVKLTASRIDGRWRAGGLILQQMPDAESDGEAASGSDEADDWRRALALMASCRQSELLDPALSDNDLLYRLFHAERVRVFRPRPLALGCRCSRARLATILRSLSVEDIAHMKVDGELVMTCQFCNVDFRFDDVALAEITAP